MSNRPEWDARDMKMRRLLFLCAVVLSFSGFLACGCRDDRDSQRATFASDVEWDTSPDSLVIEADTYSGWVPWSVVVNHIVRTKIYGDGKVVHLHGGYDVIYQGYLTTKEITQLLLFAQVKGFWEMERRYDEPGGPTDLPSSFITINLLDKQKTVSVGWGGPVEFGEIYKEFTYPEMCPSEEFEYVREEITQDDLDRGWYYGQEYQEKWNTPMDWVWIDAGADSIWSAPQ